MFLLSAEFSSKLTLNKNSFRNTIRMSNRLDPDQDRLLSLKINFALANSADPDEMSHNTFHLDLHCLQKYLFRGFKSTIGYLDY